MSELTALFTEEEQQRFFAYRLNIIEMRGIWHMPHSKSGYDETNLEGVQKLLDDMQEVGFNTIFLETTINAYTVYPTVVGSLHHAFGHYFYGPDYQNDYLKCFISEAHKRRIKVHAWTTTMRAGKLEDNLETSIPPCMNPKWLARGYHGEFGLDGKYGILMWLDPSQPEVIKHILDSYRELLSHYDLDGIELDAIRYPVSNLMKAETVDQLSDFGYTTSAISLFQSQTGFQGDLYSEILDPEVKKAWIAFRAGLITEVVSKIRDLIKEIKPGLPFSAAVFPNPDHSLSMVCQDWRKWVDNKWFDFISPMAYAKELSRVKESFEVTEEIARDTAFNLQGLSSIINEGNYQTHFEQMDLINRQGGLGSILFSIRQFVKDEATHAMVKCLYQNSPAISPLEKTGDIIDFVVTAMIQTVQKSSLPKPRKEMLLKEAEDLIHLNISSEEGYLQLCRSIARLKEQNITEWHRYLDALQKTANIKYFRTKINNNSR